MANRLSDDVLPECQDTPEEVVLLFKALLQDYSKLRTMVQETWGRYHSGHLDLASASVAVDMAIRFARQLEDQHRDTFRSHASNMPNTSIEAWKTLAKKLGTSNKSIKKIYNHNIYFHLFYNMRHGLKPEYGENVARILTRGHTLGYDEGKSPFKGVFATLSMLHFQVITKKLATVSPDKIPRVRKDHFGDCDIEKDTQNLSDSERSNHYNTLLLEALVESTLLEGSELPIDEFSSCAIQLVKGERLDLWMVFAAQAYVNSCSALGSDISRPLAQLKEYTGKSIPGYGGGIKQMREMTRNADLTSARWGSIQDTQLGEICEFLDTLHDDPIAARKGSTKGGIRSDEEFFLMRRQPLLCGLLLLISRCRMEEAGVMVETRIKGIFAITHLYNVCNHKGLLGDRKWVDLERIMEAQGSSAFFVDPNPQDDHRRYGRLYRRAAGSPAAHIRPNIASQPVKVMKQLGRLSWKLYQRFYHPQHRGSATMTDGDLKNLAKELSASPPPPSSSTTKPSNRKPQLKGPELVEALANKLDREQELMSCLYFRVCTITTLISNEVDFKMAERRGIERDDVDNRWDPVKAVDAILSNIPANLDLAAGVLREEMDRFGKIFCAE